MYYELILDALNDKGKSIKDLEDAKVLGKNTFYIFKETAPSLITIIKICNYLQISIDYLLNRTEEKSFKPYKLKQINFYNNLEHLRNSSKPPVSQSKICSDLNISRTNFSRWKNGTKPTVSKLINLANYLNCSIDDLLEREDK